MLSTRFDHIWVAMANMGYIVDTVQVLLALLVEHVLTLATNDLQRVAFEEQRHRPTVYNTNYGQLRKPCDYITKVEQNATELTQCVPFEGEASPPWAAFRARTFSQAAASPCPLN